MVKLERDGKWNGVIGSDHNHPKTFQGDEYKMIVAAFGPVMFRLINNGCPPMLMAAALAGLSGVVLRDAGLCQCPTCQKALNDTTDRIYAGAHAPFEGSSRKTPGNLILPH